MSRPSQYVDRTKPRTEYCEAVCRDCDWSAPSLGLVALQEATRYHVRTQNHRVAVRSTRIVIYRPKDAA